MVTEATLSLQLPNSLSVTDVIDRLTGEGSGVGLAADDASEAAVELRSELQTVAEITMFIFSTIDAAASLAALVAWIHGRHADEGNPGTVDISVTIDGTRYDIGDADEATIVRIIRR